MYSVSNCQHFYDNFLSFFVIFFEYRLNISIDIFISNLYNYSMDYYDRVLNTINQRNNNYTSLKNDLIKQAKQTYGEDIFSKLWLPEDYELNALTKDHFEQRYYQQTALPYSNEQFSNMFASQKTLINTPFMFNHKGKNVFGVYMLGKHNGKAVLYALTVIRDPKFKNKFTIKLDVCPQGKVWLELARLDSEGPRHPNFFIAGQPAQTKNDITYAPTPHFHKQSEQAQVLFCDDLTYTTAQDLSNVIDVSKSHTDNTFFKNCFDWFVDKTNINIHLNKNLSGDYDYSFSTPLVDYNSTVYVDTPNDFKEN